MNEELQSTNEELETINTELRDRTDELNVTNIFLESILGSLRAGVIVLDRDLTIKGWSTVTEDMWGLRADEVRGKSIFALDIGLPVDRLRDPIRECVAHDASSQVVLDATNRRGKRIRCKVSCNPMTDGGDNHHGVMLFVEIVGD